ncbi:MAG TPA: PIN domain-containing protein [Chthoniobacteraceae bacterium]|nr:PIN domain-containing protein [Chthoniobacteraceae bacterium]
MKRLVSGKGKLYLPVVVLGEYRFGLLHSRERKKRESGLAAFISASEVLEIDAETVQPYAEIRSELKTSGKPMPSNDVWIAALARQYDLPVATRDAHFSHVSGLRRLAW